MRCPSCGTPHMVEGLVRCPYCGAQMPPKPVLRKLSPESRFRVEHREEQLRVYYRWYQKGMWMLAPWCLMAVVIYAFNAPTDFRNGKIIGTTLGGLIIAGFCYLMLVALVNRTEIIVTHTALLWREGPLPWPGSPKSLPTQQIVQFSVDEYQVTDTKNRPKRYYSLNALMQGGASVPLFSGQKHNHELLTIKGGIEHWLGLVSPPVDRQADRERHQ